MADPAAAAAVGAGDRGGGRAGWTCSSTTPASTRPAGPRGSTSTSWRRRWQANAAGAWRVAVAAIPYMAGGGADRQRLVGRRLADHDGRLDARLQRLQGGAQRDHARARRRPARAPASSSTRSARAGCARTWAARARRARWRRGRRACCGRRGSGPTARPAASSATAARWTGDGDGRPLRDPRRRSGRAPAELTAAYREQAKRWHPDRNRDEASAQKMAEVNAAYDLLRAGGFSAPPRTRSRRVGARRRRRARPGGLARAGRAPRARPRAAGGARGRRGRRLRHADRHVGERAGAARGHRPAPAVAARRRRHAARGLRTLHAHRAHRPPPAPAAAPRRDAARGDDRRAAAGRSPSCARRPPRRSSAGSRGARREHERFDRRGVGVLGDRPPVGRLPAGRDPGAAAVPDRRARLLLRRGGRRCCWPRASARRSSSRCSGSPRTASRCRG